MSRKVVNGGDLFIFVTLLEYRITIWNIMLKLNYVNIMNGRFRLKGFRGIKFEMDRYFVSSFNVYKWQLNKREQLENSIVD
ncbi:hypothetical protein GCM10008967_28130 [Bacillus carboniphilus]|uniref:Uncharacterized protein n=1 Tax=Bacillus carboniphilus TaxID=86663 RepID=A0ABP3G4Y2_9BACI